MDASSHAKHVMLPAHLWAVVLIRLAMQNRTKQKQVAD